MRRTGKLLVTGMAASCILGVNVPEAEAIPLRAQITAKGASSPQTWYVVEATASGVIVSGSPSGRSGNLVAFSKIDSIAFDEPEEWADAMESYSREEFSTAAKKFSKIYTDYVGLVGYEDSYSARAKFLQMESLRRKGEYEALAKEVDGLLRKPIALSAAYTNQLQLNKAWGYAERKAWRALEQLLGEYEGEKEGGERNPNAVPLKELPAAEFVQVAYLRALLEGSEEGKEKAALNDYSRAFLMSFGAEKSVASKAVLAALELLKNHPDIETNRALKGEAYALAMTYKFVYGKGILPAEYKAFETPPPAEETEEAEAEAE